jgi:hypothetical protein
MENSIDQKTRVVSMGRGLFTLLAIGILPVLFMNPGQFLIGLVFCYAIAFGLAWVLV